MPPEDEAVQVDAYLDELLAGRHAETPHELPDPVDPELESTSRLVQRALARFHPSFLFEERLADRLRREADRSLTPTGAAETQAPPISVLRGVLSIPSLQPQGAAAAAGAPGPIVLELRSRSGLLLGGAIASGVSIAGAALIARARRARAEQRWQEIG